MTNITPKQPPECLHCEIKESISRRFPDGIGQDDLIDVLQPIAAVAGQILSFCTPETYQQFCLDIASYMSSKDGGGMAPANGVKH